MSIGPGHYMYMEADNHSPNAKARLISPTYPGSSTMCLEFWYNMYGADVGKLSVYAKGTSGTSLGAPIWSLSGNQGQDWQLGQQTFPGRRQYSVSVGMSQRRHYSVSVGLSQRCQHSVSVS